MNPHSPLVSVITPTYNRASLLPLAVRSVLEQTHANLEMIVVDDGSTDDTPRVLEALRTDGRVITHRQTNSGQSVARNAGLQLARGNFVCFLDSDNLWFPDKLERQLAYLAEHPEIDVCYGEMQRIDENGTVIGTRPSMKRHSGIIWPQLLLDNFVTFNTSMVRRSALTAIGGFDERVRVGDDYDLWLRMSVSAQFAYTGEVFGQYRVMRDQISSDKERRFLSNQQMIQRFIERNRELVSPEYERTVWATFYRRRARHRHRAGRTRDAWRDLGAAFRIQPGSVETARTAASLLVRRPGPAYRKT
jgi:glycosyltransferase involved in cell wall biosynthesis